MYALPELVPPASSSLIALAADQELDADEYLNVRPNSVCRSPLDGDVGNAIFIFHFLPLAVPADQRSYHERYLRYTHV